MITLRSSSLAALACSCICLLPWRLHALVFQNFIYTDHGDSITIDNYTGYAVPVVIPSAINGKPVTNLDGHRH